MNENITDIKRVIATLEGLDIQPTYDNMNRLLGSMQTLIAVCDRLAKEEKHGNADNE